MFWNGDATNAWGWALMVISMVAFWGLLVAGFVLLSGSRNSGAPPSTPRFTPEQVLAERFARGEIDETEYTGRQAALREQVLT